MTSTTRDSAALLQAALEAAALPLCVLDRAGVVRLATAAWPEYAPGAATYGGDGAFNYLKSLEHLARQGVAHARLLHDGLAAVLAGRSPRFRLEHPSADGRHRQVLDANALPEGGAVLTHLDVSAAHAAEMRYRRLLQRYRAITRDGRIGAWEVDPLRRRVRLDTTFCELLGYPESESSSWAEWRVRLHPDDVAGVDALWAMCAPDRTAPADRRIGPFEVRLADMRGGYRTFECMGEVVRDRDGGVITAHGTLHDVSERRAAQDAMMRSSRHLQEMAQRLAEHEERDGSRSR